MKNKKDLFNLRVLPYNAIITCVMSNRNYGKTWAFKKRAMKH